MLEYNNTNNIGGKQLSERLRMLENIIKEQVKVIKGQQITIQNQRDMINNQINESPEFDDSLEDLIDREEYGFDSEEENN